MTEKVLSLERLRQSIEFEFQSHVGDTLRFNIADIDEYREEAAVFARLKQRRHRTGLTGT